MKKILPILFLIFLPAMVYGSTASDFVVNRQSTYAVPRDVAKILVLDLTLPNPPADGTLQVKSIKIHNAGTATHLDFSRLLIWEDGPSVGWDNDETQVAEVLTSPFDTEISGTFRGYTRGDSWQRIFVTLDITSETISATETTIKPALVINSVVFADQAFDGPTDASVIGFERIISRDASIPTVPVAPLAGTPEALSTSAIRWYFTDLSNNEFGFKILDSQEKVVVQKDEANLSYFEEGGLQPDTEYAGRRVVAFNDRGENLSSALSVFPAVRTLEEQKIAPAEGAISTPTSSEPAAIQEIKKEPTLFETIQTKIADIQRQINELLQKLNELIGRPAATIWQALSRFLQSFVEK